MSTRTRDWCKYAETADGADIQKWKMQDRQLADENYSNITRFLDTVVRVLCKIWNGFYTEVCSAFFSPAYSILVSAVFFLLCCLFI